MYGRLAVMSVRPHTTMEVAAAVSAGHKVRFLFFWGHRPPRDGGVGRGCLSQWWPARFEVDGISFATAEHYMMWRKAMLFGDDRVAEQILAAPHPHRAKALGRQVADFDHHVWEAQRCGILARFGQHSDLHAYLLGTGERILVEASPVDRVWGIGLAAEDPHASDPTRWRGLNLLGFALMKVRDALRDRRSPK